VCRVLGIIDKLGVSGRSLNELEGEAEEWREGAY